MSLHLWFFGGSKNASCRRVKTNLGKLRHFRPEQAAHGRKFNKCSLISFLNKL